MSATMDENNVSNHGRKQCQQPWTKTIFQQFLLKSRQRRRKRAFYFEEKDNFFDEDVQQDDVLNHISALSDVLKNKPARKVRTPDKDRETRKHYWDDLYRQKTDDEFMDKMRILHATCNLRYYFEYLMGSTYPPTDKFEAVSDITGQAACSVFVPSRSWRFIFRFRGRLFDRLIDFNHVYIDNTKFIMGWEVGGGC